MASGSCVSAGGLALCAPLTPVKHFIPLVLSDLVALLYNSRSLARNVYPKPPSLNTVPEIPLFAHQINIAFSPDATSDLPTAQGGLRIGWTRLPCEVDCPRVSWALEAEEDTVSEALWSRLNPLQSEEGAEPMVRKSATRIALTCQGQL